MFFIYGTDAPIYHYPIVTTVMVVINVFVHLLISATGYDVTPWILSFGDGLHPLQWVTHNFFHVGWLHLIGNMLFLFPFGLIIEGKIGWWRMLCLYMAIGTLQGFTQQAIMLSADPIDDARALVDLFNDPENPIDEETKDALTKQWRKDLMKDGFGSLGASAVIFGLLAICAIWAPVNEFDVYFRWSLLVSAPDGGEREWSVLTVCGIFVAKEFCMFLMMGMPISSEALHLNGFVVGAVLGLSTLYYGLVDCEGFDLISLGTGSKFVSKRTIARERKERREAIEAARPQGPPQAIVPRMAHQLQPQARHLANLSAPSPTLRTGPDPSRPIELAPMPAVPQPTTPKPAGSPHPILFDAELPDFDDGSSSVDPIESAKFEIEAMVARGDCVSAVRTLSELRKQDPGAVLSAAAMGRLAEGLLKGKHIQPAVKVLSIACDTYPAYAARWRIRLAAIELAVNQDPIQAIRQLRFIDKDELDSTLRAQYLKVADKARRMAGR